MIPFVAIAIIGSSQIGPDTFQVDYLTLESDVVTVTQPTEYYLMEIGEHED